MRMVLDFCLNRLHSLETKRRLKKSCGMAVQRLRQGFSARRWACGARSFSPRAQPLPRSGRGGESLWLRNLRGIGREKASNRKRRPNSHPFWAFARLGGRLWNGLSGFGLACLIKNGALGVFYGYRTVPGWYHGSTRPPRVSRDRGLVFTILMVNTEHPTPTSNFEPRKSGQCDIKATSGRMQKAECRMKKGWAKPPHATSMRHQCDPNAC